MIKKHKTGILSYACCLLVLSIISGYANAATTGMDFAGGCPEAMSGLCANGGNANVDNVAAILGIDALQVSEVFSGFSFTTDNSNRSGNWTVTDPTITHLAFKSSTYFILGALNAGSGTWDNDTTAPGGWDLSLAICPLSICSSADTNRRKGDRSIGPRAYVDADFLSNGGRVSSLSNVRAFSVTVVPVPAAIWLFGSGLLGLIGIARHKKTT